MSDSLFRAPSADDLDARPYSERNTAAIRSSAPERSVISSSPEMDAPALDCTQSFLNLLSTHFLICNDKIKGDGEDSGIEAYTRDVGIIGAFDGCGGLGAKCCPAVSDRTEAYLASRAVGAAVKRWFYANAAAKGNWSLEELRGNIDSNLDLCQRNSGDSGLRLRGSLVRPFPTTMAMVRFQIVDRKLVTEHIWAGDSRTYLLDKRGLAQVSVDDVQNQDAMSNLTNDGALTNVISADKQYVLHHATIVPKHPCIFFCASDGCFGYVSSPMEFEHMILQTLMESDSIIQWKQKLSDAIYERAGDDQTIAIAAFGFETFTDFKAYYMGRYSVMHQLVQTYEQSDQEQRQRLWEAYRPGYYRHIADKE